MNILVVEDDRFFRANVVRSLKQYGNIFSAGNLKDALKHIKSEKLDIAFVDLNLTDDLTSFEGLSVVDACKELSIETFVLTGHESREVISKAYERGCHHYFSKFDFDSNVSGIIGNILKNRSDDQLNKFFETDYITTDNGLKGQIKFIKDQALGINKVLITGETGVGKTKIAKFVHKLTDENSPFVHVNLSELQENLIESELFGHKKGAFTGADSNKVGLIEMANNGTLFIDEIGTTPISIQKKLLKVIEEKKFTPVGSTEEKMSNFRLITATCDDLPSLIEEEKFRVDFYFRIKGAEINIPPLRKRKDDIGKLVDYFISKSPRKIAFSEDAYQALIEYDWKGNIRELENFITEMASFSVGLININNLPPYMHNERLEFAKVNCAKNVEEGRTLVTSSMKEIVSKHGLGELIKRIENEFFIEARKNGNGKINEIARKLQISKSLLYRIQKNVDEV